METNVLVMFFRLRRELRGLEERVKESHKKLVNLKEYEDDKLIFQELDLNLKQVLSKMMEIRKLLFGNGYFKVIKQDKDKEYIFYARRMFKEELEQTEFDKLKQFFAVWVGETLNILDERFYMVADNKWCK